MTKEQDIYKYLMSKPYFQTEALEARLSNTEVE